VLPISLSDGDNVGIVTLGHDRAEILIRACDEYAEIGTEGDTHATIEDWQLDFLLQTKEEACDWELTGFLHSTGIDFRDYWDKLTASYAGAFDHIEALEKMFAEFKRMARDQADAIDKIGQ